MVQSNDMMPFVKFKLSLDVDSMLIVLYYSRTFIVVIVSAL